MKREGGGVGRKSFSHAEGGGGGTKIVGVYVVACSFSHIELELDRGGGGGHKKFPLFKKGGGVQKVLPCLEGWGPEVSDMQFSHFVAPPPLPVINNLMTSP